MKRRIGDAVPPMPVAFMAKIDGTLKEISNMKYTKSVTRYGALAIALLMILALSGLAFAASHSGLLDRLFGESAPPEAERALQTNVGSEEDEGVRFSIGEVLTDGASARIQWKVESMRDDPVYYFVRCRFDDAESSATMTTATAETSGMQMAMLDGAEDGLGMGRSRDGFMDVVYTNGQKPVGSTRATVTVYAYHSNLTPTPIQRGDAEDIYMLKASDPLVRELETSRSLGITPDGLLNVEAYAAYVEALALMERESAAEWADDSLHREALVKSGIFEPVCALEIQMEIDFGANDSVRETRAAQTEYELPTGKLRVNEMDFGIASTRVSYDFMPIQPIQSRDEDWAWEEEIGAAWDFVLVDPDDVILSETLQLGKNAMLLETNGGETYIHVQISGLPAKSVPEYVMLTPTNKVENETGMRVHEWFVKSIAEARPEDCVKIAIESK